MLRRRMPSPRRCGTAAVETAVVLIPTCLLIFAVLEYGRVIMMLQVMNNAAREGCRAAVAMSISTLTPAVADTNAKATITTYLAKQNLSNLNVQIYQTDSTGKNIGAWTNTPFGQNIAVQIDADLPLLFPTFGMLPNSGAASNSIHLRVKVMMESEAN